MAEPKRTLNRVLIDSKDFLLDSENKEVRDDIKEIGNKNEKWLQYLGNNVTYDKTLLVFRTVCSGLNLGFSRFLKNSTDLNLAGIQQSSITFQKFYDRTFNNQNDKKLLERLTSEQNKDYYNRLKNINDFITNLLKIIDSSAASNHDLKK